MDAPEQKTAKLSMGYRPTNSNSYTIDIFIWSLYSRLKVYGYRLPRSFMTSEFDGNPGFVCSTWYCRDL